MLLHIQRTQQQKGLCDEKPQNLKAITRSLKESRSSMEQINEEPVALWKFKRKTFPRKHNTHSTVRNTGKNINLRCEHRNDLLLVEPLDSARFLLAACRCRSSGSLCANAATAVLRCARRRALISGSGVGRKEPNRRTSNNKTRCCTHSKTNGRHGARQSALGQNTGEHFLRSSL